MVSRLDLSHNSLKTFLLNLRSTTALRLAKYQSYYKSQKRKKPYGISSISRVDWSCRFVSVDFISFKLTLKCFLVENTRQTFDLTKIFRDFSNSLFVWKKNSFNEKISLVFLPARIISSFVARSVKRRRWNTELVKCWISSAKKKFSQWKSIFVSSFFYLCSSNFSRDYCSLNDEEQFRSNLEELHWAKENRQRRVKQMKILRVFYRIYLKFRWNFLNVSNAIANVERARFLKMKFDRPWKRKINVNLPFVSVDGMTKKRRNSIRRGDDFFSFVAHMSNQRFSEWSEVSTNRFLVLTLQFFQCINHLEIGDWSKESYRCGG